MESQEIMTLDQLINTFGTSVIIFYFFIPTFVVLSAIYVARRIKARAANKHKQKVNQAQVENKKEAVTKIDSLGLEFDKSGSIKGRTDKNK